MQHMTLIRQFDMEILENLVEWLDQATIMKEAKLIRQNSAKSDLNV